MHKLDDDFVVCQLCDKKFKRISNTHLKKYHNMTMKKYKEKFPKALMETCHRTNTRGDHSRGKTYIEMFGPVKAKELKDAKRSSAIEQMKDPNQIRVRSKDNMDSKTRKKSNEKMKQTKRNTEYYNANNYRNRALEHYGRTCSRCGKIFPKKRLVVHHIDCNNYNSEIGNHSLENLTVMCRSCHSKLHNELRRTSTRYVGLYDIEKGMHLILKGLRKEFGLKIKDQHFLQTPKRVARAYAEIFEGVKDTEKQIDSILSTAFKDDTDEMIVVNGIHVFSMCPHHFLPVELYISIAYIPNGHILGISKLARLAEILAKRPVVQEQLTNEITKYLMKIKPQGAAAYVEGQHFCMRMRGVSKPESVTVTTSVVGAFKKNQATRSEFLSLIEKGNF